MEPESMKVVCLIDFSPNARLAVERASELVAGSRAGELVLLHCMEGTDRAWRCSFSCSATACLWRAKKERADGRFHFGENHKISVLSHIFFHLQRQRTTW